MRATAAARSAGLMCTYAIFLGLRYRSAPLRPRLYAAARIRGL